MQNSEIKQTGFSDFIDNVDRYLYGRKMKNFLIGSICVLIIAPLLDWLLEVPYDRLTWLATLVFLFYVLLLVLAWVSAWRDDAGKWTMARALARLKTYYLIFRHTAEDTRTKSSDELLYKTGGFLFFGAIGWKALQNLSVFVRKPIQKLTHHTMIRFIHFEHFTHRWYWLPLITGIGIMIYLYKSNPQITDRIKTDLKRLFGRKQHVSYFGGIHIDVSSPDKMILNTKKERQMELMAASANSPLFKNFVAAIQSWNPGRFQYEYGYQENLMNHLNSKMKNSTVASEYPIPSDNTSRNAKRRGDIVIDDTILIEMKREHLLSSDTDRASGQIGSYAELWKGRGPVILLLCGYKHENAQDVFGPTMTRLAQSQNPVLTFVVEH